MCDTTKVKRYTLYSIHDTFINISIDYYTLKIKPINTLVIFIFRYLSLLRCYHIFLCRPIREKC